MPQSERARPQKTEHFTVVRDDGPEAERLRGAVVAIGNFDGVHRGHRSVIEFAMNRAAEGRRPSAVLTLEPHPRSYFRPDEKLFRLTDERQKLRLLAATVTMLADRSVGREPIAPARRVAPEPPAST